MSNLEIMVGSLSLFNPSLSWLFIVNFYSIFYLTGSQLAIFNCTFEDGGNALCGMTQDTTDKFDWTRNSGHTPTQGTGPTQDHTLGGSNAGNYMYIEATNRLARDHARLVSPFITRRGPFCLTFWYHMRGHHIGFLRIFQRTPAGEGEMWRSPAAGPENNETVWQQQSVTLSDGVNHFVIEGERGGWNEKPSFGNQGDIALDDVSLSLGSCKVSTSPPTTFSPTISTANTSAMLNTTAESAIYLMQCDFEATPSPSTSNSTCLLTQDRSDDFSWIQNWGPTPSQGTGPDTDHTLGSVGSPTGHYMYIEASIEPNSTGKVGDVARFVSPDLSKWNTTLCLAFWFHMKGQHIGMLSVYTRTKMSNNRSKIWEQIGEYKKNTDWNQVQLRIEQSVQQFDIEGSRGDGYQGDIGLDDVTLKSDSCTGNMVPSSSSEPACDTSYKIKTTKLDSGLSTGQLLVLVIGLFIGIILMATWIAVMVMFGDLLQKYCGNEEKDKALKVTAV